MKNSPKARNAVETLTPYTCARDLYKQADVFLDANENAYGSAIASPLSSVELNRYPDSASLGLCGELALYVGVSVKQVLAGNGSDEIISLAASAFCDKGDNVITLQPGYSMWGVCSAIAGAKEKIALMSDDFKLNAENVLKQTDSRTRIIFLASPNAATGGLVEESEVRTLLEKFDGLIFIDEAYFEFNGKTLAPLVQDYGNLLVSRTLSKAWGLAALRVGYCISNEKIIASLRKIKLPYNINSLSQQLAVQALQKGKGVMTQNVLRIVGEKETLKRSLSKIGLQVFESRANFLLVRLPPQFNSSKIQTELAGKSIIVRARSGLPMLQNCIRITVGTREENDKLAGELGQILEAME